MADFDIELVGKIGSMALIDREYQDMNYNIIARLSRELRPGRTIPRRGSPYSCRRTGSSSTAVSA